MLPLGSRRCSSRDYWTNTRYQFVLQVVYIIKIIKIHNITYQYFKWIHNSGLCSISNFSVLIFDSVLFIFSWSFQVLIIRLNVNAKIQKIWYSVLGSLCHQIQLTFRQFFLSSLPRISGPSSWHCSLYWCPTYSLSSMLGTRINWIFSR